jgi:hypothetical protein
METIFEGKQLEKEHVREYDPELNEYYQASQMAEAEE